MEIARIGRAADTRWMAAVAAPLVARWDFIREPNRKYSWRAHPQGLRSHAPLPDFGAAVEDAMAHGFSPAKHYYAVHTTLSSIRTTHAATGHADPGFN
jgi:hypothetical protein